MLPIREGHSAFFTETCWHRSPPNVVLVTEGNSLCSPCWVLPTPGAQVDLQELTIAHISICMPSTVDEDDDMLLMMQARSYDET